MQNEIKTMRNGRYEYTNNRDGGWYVYDNYILHGFTLNRERGFGWYESMTECYYPTLDEALDAHESYADWYFLWDNMERRNGIIG